MMTSSYALTFLVIFFHIGVEETTKSTNEEREREGGGERGKAGPWIDVTSVTPNIRVSV